MHELYAAKERAVCHADLRDQIFDGDVDQYKLVRLVHETRRVIQGSGWHIATVHGRGYQMLWVDKDAPEKPPETIELMRCIEADVRALRADVGMLGDTMREMMAAIATVPAHLLVPSSTWTREIDATLLDTKGITGKLAEVALQIGVDGTAVISRYKALKNSDR